MAKEPENPFTTAANAEEKKITADEKREVERKEAERKAASPNPPFTPVAPANPSPFAPLVQTQVEKDSAKSAEEVRLRALNDAKVAEEQKKKAVADSEAAAKKAQEEATARAKKLHEEDELRQREAKEMNARVEEKLKQRRAEREKQRKEILEEATIILKEYGGAESNIPVSSGYWGLMNTYRGLQNELR